MSRRVDTRWMDVWLNERKGEASGVVTRNRNTLFIPIHPECFYQHEILLVVYNGEHFRSLNRLVCWSGEGVEGMKCRTCA